MEITNITSLPQEIHHRVLQTVCERNPKDLLSARLAHRAFDNSWRDDHFYRTVDLISMKKRELTADGLRFLYHRCDAAGNPSALYLRGVHEIFTLNLVDEGLQKIQLSGERGCLAGKYTYTMMKLVLSVDSEGRFPSLPHMARDYPPRMRRLLTKKMEGFLYYKKPPFWEEAEGRLRIRGDLWCPCPNYCDSCFWYREVTLFMASIIRTAQPWPA